MRRQRNDREKKNLLRLRWKSTRQTLYSAIGQLLVHDHSKDGGCRRFLVLPIGDAIPDDIGQALKRAKISVLRFELRGEKARIVDG